MTAVSRTDSHTNHQQSCAAPIVVRIIEPQQLAWL
jgi:hypothetical protein